MAKRLILVVSLWVLLCSPALAVDFVCFTGYQIDEEEVEASSPAMAEGSGEDATTDSIIIYEYYDNYSISPLSSNYPSYTDGMISSSYIDWAKGYLSTVSTTENYVFARTGQYQYIMAVGDFDGGFAGVADVYILNLARSGYDYSYSVLYEEPFTLSVGSSLVYSSVPGYPNLSGADRSADLLVVSAVVILGLIGLWLARLVFSPLLGWR